MTQANIGIIGLGVMGHNLALNMERNGFAVAGYDVDAQRTQAFLTGEAAGKRIQGAATAEELMKMLEAPRRVLVMVPAGPAMDSVIAHVKSFMQAGDILIDGGNSYFMDTERRSQELAKEGFYFVGMGVSGGEEGALWGPSLMPGGQREAWDALAPILRSIAAKAEDGVPCVDYIGPRGAGHYVKMVHNGIEYGDMQLIAEVYDLLHRGAGFSNADLSKIFAEWNEGALQSYLIQITAEILSKIDADTGQPLVDMILDEAQQKGTGKWASQNSMDVGAPIHTINAAVESRMISALKPQRVTASKLLGGPSEKFTGSCQKLVDAARDALYASKITSYAQGMGLLRMASDEYQYDLQLGSIASLWRAGCIIRAQFLDEIMAAYERDAHLVNLMLDDHFRGVLSNSQADWRMVLQTAIGMGIPVLAMAASLGYYDAYRSAVLPANLTQAQRDYFGAHTYRRADKAGTFHTDWSQK